MNRMIFSFVLLFLLGLTNVTAVTDPDEMAIAARDADIEPDIAVSSLMAAGYGAARAAHSVAKAWDDCDATGLAVAAAVSANPAAAAPVVAAVSSIEGCGCSAETMWSRTRLENRLRDSIQITLVEISDHCSCAAAAIQAAVELVPERTDEIVSSTINRRQQQAAPIDSMGRKGRFEIDGWNELFAAGVGPDASFRRLEEICEGDTVGTDEFLPTDEWRPVEADKKLSSLGQHEHDCDSLPDLMISEFSLNNGQGSYVEIFNGTGDEIDLTASRIFLTIHFKGNDRSSYTVPLQGEIEADAVLVLAAPTLVGSLPVEVGQIDAGIAIRAGDYLVLHTIEDEEDCECAEPIAAAGYSSGQQQAVTGLADRTNSQAGIATMFCSAIILTLQEKLLDGPALFALRPGTVGPRDQAPPIPRVDPIASPN